MGLEVQMDRELTYSERWYLAYNETFAEWGDRNMANGVFIIPSCALEDVWDKQGIPKYESQIKKNK